MLVLLVLVVLVIKLSVADNREVRSTVKFIQMPSFFLS